jgi:hypothetical protein
MVARRPALVAATGLFLAALASLGLVQIRLTTDPVELWSSPGSRARAERHFFNTQLTFVPFFPFFFQKKIIKKSG